MNKILSYLILSYLIVFDKLRKNSENIGNYKKIIMTTADGMTKGKGKHPTFSGRHPKPFIISDRFRLFTEIAEVNYTHLTLSHTSRELSIYNQQDTGQDDFVSRFMFKEFCKYVFKKGPWKGKRSSFFH